MLVEAPLSKAINAWKKSPPPDHLHLLFRPLGLARAAPGRTLQRIGELPIPNAAAADLDLALAVRSDVHALQ